MTRQAKRVLVVDDDAAMLRAIVRMLTTRYQVTSTTEPREALELFIGSRFDALLTDLEMPNIDGGTLIAELRKHANFATIPMFVLTGTPVTHVPGATAVLHKPADPERLLRTLSRSLTETRTLRSSSIVA